MISMASVLINGVTLKPLEVIGGYPVTPTVSSDVLLDKDRGAKNLQNECLSYIFNFSYGGNISTRIPTMCSIIKYITL